jgi:hypothetical protein
LEIGIKEGTIPNSEQVVNIVSGSYKTLKPENMKAFYPLQPFSPPFELCRHHFSSSQYVYLAECQSFGPILLTEACPTATYSIM